MNFFKNNKSKEKKGYSVQAVANAVLVVAHKEGLRLDALQLHRLVYIAQGMALAAIGRPLFHNTIEAWFYSPAIPDLLISLRKYGKEGIVTHLFVTEDRMLDDAEAMDVINTVVVGLGAMTDRELAGLTHYDDTPWAISKRRHQRVMSLDLMREKFTEWFINDDVLRQEGEEAPAPRAEEASAGAHRATAGSAEAVA